MTSPAQDAPGPLDFDLDPQAVIASLTAQRNEALDREAQWRAAAMQERATTRYLAARVAELEPAPDKQPTSPRRPRKATAPKA